MKSLALRSLAQYLRRHPWLLSFVVGAVILSAVISRALPWVIGQMVDRAILPKNGELFLQLVYLYLGLEILKMASRFASTYFFRAFGNRMLYYIREDLYRHVLALPLSYFHRTPMGRTITQMTSDIAALGELFSESVVAIFTQGALLLATITAMFWLAPSLAFVTLVTAPLVLWATHKQIVKVRALMHEMKGKLSALNAFLAENIAGLRIIQLHNKIDRQTRRFADLVGQDRDRNLEVIRQSALMQPLLNLFNAILMTSALAFGGWLVHAGEIPLGVLITFLLYSQDFMFPVREILERLQQFQNSLTSAERVFQLLNEPAEADLGGPPLPNLRGEIALRGLTFRYRDDLPWALQDVTVDIKGGQSVAVVGRTGSGKTTLISLLQRFYEVPSDQILLDGRPLASYPRRPLRRKLGVIHQDPVIFRGTLRLNLALGRDDVPDERLLEACRRVGLRRSLDLLVDERGVNLSLGERQLIAFARILVFDPEILILDEATANIDSETERLLQEATVEVTRGRTSLLIAHRLSTVAHCDQVLVLDQGRLIESGSPAELLRAGGAYAQLASAGFQIT